MVPGPCVSSQPAEPGPPLQPHQLFVACAVAPPATYRPVPFPAVLPTIRLTLRFRVPPSISMAPPCWSVAAPPERVLVVNVELVMAMVLFPVTDRPPPTPPAVLVTVFPAMIEFEIVRLPLLLV